MTEPKITDERPVRLVLMCADAAHHHALAGKLHAASGLCGVVVEARTAKHKEPAPVRLMRSLISRIRFGEIHRSWSRLMAYYARAAQAPGNVPQKRVADINDPSLIAFVNGLTPDLIVVSGTEIIGGSTLAALKPRCGIINLHTGLSPYVRGGPNCTNWCIANGDYHLIGNTVMWIDEGIDTGNIIASEQVIFNGPEKLFDIQLKVMESAHELTLKVISRIRNSGGRVNSRSQRAIGSGRLFSSREWNAEKKILLLRNLRKGSFRNCVQAPEYQANLGKVAIVSLASH